MLFKDELINFPPEILLSLCVNFELSIVDVLKLSEVNTKYNSTFKKLAADNKHRLIGYQPSDAYQYKNNRDSKGLLSQEKLKELIPHIINDNLEHAWPYFEKLTLPTLLDAFSAPFSDSKRKTTNLFQLINKHFSQSNKRSILTVYEDYQYEKNTTSFNIKPNPVIELAICLGVEIETIYELFIKVGKIKRQRDLFELCATYNNSSLACFFLDSGLEINDNTTQIYYSLGHRALNAACRFGHEEMLDFLIARDVKVKNDTSLLRIAVENGYQRIVERLLNEGAKITLYSIYTTQDNNQLEIYSAVKNGQKTCLEVLLNHIKDKPEAYNNIKEHFKELLSLAISNGHTYTAKLLCGHGAVMDYWQVRDALHRGNYTLLRFFLDNGGKFPKDSIKELLINAAGSGHLAIVKYFASLNEDPKTLCSALKKASHYGHLPVVKFLVEQGVDTSQLSHRMAWIDNSSCTDVTALVEALLAGQPEVAEFLITKTNLELDSPITPLHWACLKAYTPCINLMLEIKPDLINRKNDDNKSPLVVSLQGLKDEEECLKIVRLLIDKKANINERVAIEGPEEFHTPLHYAALRNSTPLVKLLLEKGADPTAKTKGNKLPAALVTNNVELTIILVKAAQAWREKTPKIGFFKEEIALEKNHDVKPMNSLLHQ